MWKSGDEMVMGSAGNEEKLESITETSVVAKKFSKGNSG